MDKKNVFFFFNTEILKDKNRETWEGKLSEKRNEVYINHLDKEDKEFSNCIHYISAAAKALNDTVGIEYVVGASDNNTSVFKEYLENDFKNNRINEHEHCIDWTENYNIEEGTDKVIEIITNKIESLCPIDSINKVYILITSGLRNQVMFFSTFVQILKARGFEVKMIHVENSKPKQKVVYIEDEIKYYDVLKAVELFTEVGNPYKLIKYYEKSESLKNLFECMRRFYESIQLCKNIQGRNQAETSVLDIYSEMLSEIDNLMNSSNNADIDIIMKLMLPKIKSDFKPLGNDRRDFLQILKWCSNNYLISQGYFIFDAEFNYYLMKQGILSFNTSEESGILSSDEFSEIIQNEYPNNLTPHLEKEMSDYGKRNNTDDYYIRIILRNFISATAPQKVSNNWTKLFLSRNCGEIKNKFDAWRINVEDISCKKLFKIIALREVIRNIRNNMAHSGSRGVIENDYNISLKYGIEILNTEITKIKDDIEHKEYTGNDIWTSLNTTTRSRPQNVYLNQILKKDVYVSDEKGYDKCTDILKAALKILTEYK